MVHLLWDHMGSMWPRKKHKGWSGCMDCPPCVSVDDYRRSSQCFNATKLGICDHWDCCKVQGDERTLSFGSVRSPKCQLGQFSLQATPFDLRWKCCVAHPLDKPHLYHGKANFCMRIFCLSEVLLSTQAHMVVTKSSLPLVWEVLQFLHVVKQWLHLFYLFCDLRPTCLECTLVLSMVASCGLRTPKSLGVDRQCKVDELIVLWTRTQFFEILNILFYSIWLFFSYCYVVPWVEMTMANRSGSRFPALGEEGC